MKTNKPSEQPPPESFRGTSGADWRSSGNSPGGYLIRIAEKQNRERALRAFRRVREAHVRFPGHVMGVTEEHLRALTMDKIPFEYLSKAPDGEEKNATV